MQLGKKITLNRQVGRREECYSRGISKSVSCVCDDLFLRLGGGYRVFMILFLIPLYVFLIPLKY